MLALGLRSCPRAPSRHFCPARARPMTLLPVPSHCWGHPPAPADIFHPGTTSSECPSPPGSPGPAYQTVLGQEPGSLRPVFGSGEKGLGLWLISFPPTRRHADTHGPTPTCVCARTICRPGGPADAQHNLGSGSLTPNLPWQASKILPEPRQGFVLSGKGRRGQPVAWPRVAPAPWCPRAGLRLRGAPGPSHVSWTFLGLLAKC